MQRDDNKPTPALKDMKAKPERMNEEEFVIIDASTLFGRSREIGINHKGALYRLKITRQGKLILNK